MRGKQTSGHWAAPLARRLGLDANPLRRGTDRAEAWIRIGLVLVFLVGGPLAGWGVGRWAEATAARAAAVQLASDHRVSATLLRNVPFGPDYPFRTALSLGWVKARWPVPGGGERTGYVQVPLGSRAGSTVPVWTNRTGAITTPPLLSSQVHGWELMCAVLAPVLLGLLLAMALGAARGLLDRRRLASWEQAWSAVEPQWTRRLR